MRNTKLFRRNVIIVLFYLLAPGFLLFKTEKAGRGRGTKAEVLLSADEHV